MDGLLIVDKSGMPPLALGRSVAELTPLPNGRSPYPTSHDVVQQVRRLSHQRRIGHTGTLDPMASGVLVLCLGWATRLVEYYQGHDKRYRAEITFGSETDTCDALGSAIRTGAIPTLTPAIVEAALAEFRGDIQQTPPIYSALKQNGESIHYKARRGEDVTVEARPVTISELTLLEIESPRITVLVECSAGTYIRSLARDLGRVLGSAATLTALRRERAGAFTLDHAHTINEVELAASTSTLGELLLPAGAGLDLPRIVVEPEAAQRLGNGQRVLLSSVASAGLWQARDESGQLIGIVKTRISDGDVIAKAEKWFGMQQNAAENS